MKLFAVLILSLVSATALAEITAREDTALTIKLGPFVDSTDGVTPETALTISQADVRLAKNDGAWAQKSDTNACTHEENGWYECALNTTDLDTVGTLIVNVNESGALPVWRMFQVVEEAVYDACCAASAAPLTAASVWTNGTRTLTAGTNIVLAKGTGVTGFNDLDAAGVRSAVGLASANLDTQLSGLSSAIAVIDGIVDQLLVGVNVERINANDVCGTGDSGNAWTGCP